MEQETKDRQKLAAYLLGNLPVAEQDEMADRYFVDDAFFAKLQDVENDLIDDYVRGQLPVAERRQLESYLSRHPDGSHKVIVARALAGVVEIAPSRKPESSALAAFVRPVSDSVGLWPRLLALFKQPVFALACVTGLLFSSGVLIWLLQRNQRLSQDNQQLRALSEQHAQRQAQLQRDVRELEERKIAEQKRAMQLEEELAREKQLRPAQTPPNSNNPFWILSAVVLKDPSAKPGTVPLNRATKAVDLKIPAAAGKSYTGYRVLLRTIDRQRLWEENLLHTPPPRAGRFIIFTRPASEFAETGYQLTLTLIEANGTETTCDYYFTVERQ